MRVADSRRHEHGADHAACRHDTGCHRDRVIDTDTDGDVDGVGGVYAWTVRD
jgi:hypothetical protein